MNSTTPIPGGASREPIARSWRRATMAGLRPSTALRDTRHTEIDRRSSLLAAAGPVLDELDDRLMDTLSSTVLVEPAGFIVRRWCGDRIAAACLDKLGIDQGTCLQERAVGTNAPGTALETRAGIVVHGSEHFAEELRVFSCYAQPIFHPVTRRLEGAFDLSVLASQANPLLAPVVAKAVAEIEQRLLEGSRISEQVLLGAFQSAARRGKPVVAIGEDLLLSNQAAADLLDSADLALLRSLDFDLARPAELDLELRSGQRARARAERVPGARGGVLVDIVPLDATPVPRQRPRSEGSDRVSTQPVGHLHIAGPIGSGRTTEAHARATRQPCTVLTAGEAVRGGVSGWAAEFTEAVRTETGTICVDGVDLLPAELVDLVATHAAADRPPHLVLTTGTPETLSEGVRALTAHCAETVELLPLAHRISELRQLTARILDELGAGQTHHLTPGALRVLGSYDWPGNLTQLRAVLRHALGKRGTGAITAGDLPATVSADAVSRDFGLIERAERNAIIAALRAANGNKAKAARILGISRTTLYTRMRVLKVRSPGAVPGRVSS